MKNLARTLLISTMLGVLGSVMAQGTPKTSNASNECTAATEEQYLALGIGVVTDKLETVNSLLNKYCYNFNYYRQDDKLPPFFFAHNVTMLKLFENKKIDFLSFQEKSTGLDYFSFALVSHVNAYKFSDKEKKKLSDVMKKYDPTVTEKSFSTVTTPEDRAQILSYLAPLYKKSYIQKKDIYNNNSLSYVILTGEHNLINVALGAYSTNAALFRKNKEGIAPLHLVFAMNYIEAKDEATKKKMKEKTNDEIIKLMDRSKIGLAGIKDMTFFEYAEMMKEENPDFYNKLKTKFGFTVKSNPKNFEQYRVGLGNSMKYPERMKALSADK